MKILVVGNGGREHAIAKALLEDKKVHTVYSLPERVSLKDLKPLPSDLLNDWEALSLRLKKEEVELVVIGPEKPLADGLSDFLREKGLKVFGPGAGASQLEASKIFAKKFMKEQGIPTASYRVLTSVSETLQAGESFFPPFVLKADGLAGGKGVFICESRAELEEKARFLFEKQGLGSSGKKALLEDFQSGKEISFFIISNGETYRMLPVAKDYKRLYEGKKGPNTGGMGAVAPQALPSDLVERIESMVIKPTLKGLEKRGLSYRGFLYLGLMINKNIPKVLEYNVRMGDPEAQVLLPLLDGSWADLFYQTASGHLPELKWKNLHSACVVLCAEGYPKGPIPSRPIKGSIYYKGENSWFIHGSLIRKEDQWMTKGGRVMSAVGVGESRERALKRAYLHAEKISWQGMHYRKDIGADE